jgi:hypothetical protein
MYLVICKRLDLRFQSLSREIAARHSSHGAKFGERVDPVKDGEHRLRRREHSGKSGIPDLQNIARVLDRIEAVSPIMLGPCDEWRNLTMTDGSNLDFYR